MEWWKTHLEQEHLLLNGKTAFAPNMKTSRIFRYEMLPKLCSKVLVGADNEWPQYIGG